MKRYKNLFFASFIFLVTSITLNAQPDSLLEAITKGEFKAQQINQITHLKDGVHYTQLSQDGTLIIRFNYATEMPVDTLFNILTIPDCPIKSISGYSFDNAEQKILVHTDKKPIYRRSFTTTYYVYTIKRNRIVPLSTEGDEQQNAKFSPNGRIIAFARNNNLFLKKLDFNTEIAITKDGEKNKIINGTADWVYEEEFAETCYFDWNPESNLLAYVRFDENPVNNFSFQWFTENQPSLQTYKYPSPGTPNSQVTLHVYDVENRTTKQMQLDYNDCYLPRLQWSNSTNELSVVRLNRNQTTLDLFSVNARSGVATSMIHESEKTYVDYENFNHLQFNSDNSFVCLSERSGYRHLYLFDAKGRLIKQLTSGNWDVTKFYGYDEKNKTVYFQAAKESPLERHVYKIDSKNKLTCFDNRAGTHTADFGQEYKYYIHQFNNTTTPNIYTIFNIGGKRIRTLETNAALKADIEKRSLPSKKFFKFTTSEGIVLNGWIIEPIDHNSSVKRPLVMIQYSGPDSQEVLNKWKYDWEYDLAQQGYVVACVDGRGTGARGRQFRTCTYWNLGELETKDQVEAAKYLGTQNNIDKERIAIWGWSYGGFMTLNCLTYGNGIFKAGIAVAPVTNWMLYNTAYTERFMSRPQENYKGYAQSNLLDKAAQLQGNLLIVHGTADDNVHAQQTLLYTEKLVEAGKQFEMQLYTNKNHSILGDKTRLHLYTRFNEFLKKNL